MTHKELVVGARRNVPTAKLKTNGIDAPHDFPVGPYEAVHSVTERARATDRLYEQFAGAWNAVAYRFVAMTKYGDAFAESLKQYGAAPGPEQRYEQETQLFGFFSSGFSVLEATFYGLFVIGAFVKPAAFPLTTEKEQQQVSPTRTKAAFANAFGGDPILESFAKVFGDPAYQGFRETRNILTHRAAPGRRMFVSIGADDAPPAEWKLNNAPLDASLAKKGRGDIVRLLGELLIAAEDFTNRNLH